MKVNAKLGGVNWGLARPPFPWVAEPFICFGASVSHSGEHKALSATQQACPLSMNGPNPYVHCLAMMLPTGLAGNDGAELLPPNRVEQVKSTAAQFTFNVAKMAMWFVTATLALMAYEAD